MLPLLFELGQPLLKQLEFGYCLLFELGPPPAQPQRRTEEERDRMIKTVLFSIA
jgi:hypothetical protein